jgi:pimeloyl-ACP methyl ester carboxylesterase
LLSNTLNALDVDDHLSEVSCPTFIGLGRYDFIVPPTIWDARRADFPSATFQVFERSGHFPMLEEQALFDQRLFEWFGQHDPPWRMTVPQELPLDGSQGGAV